MTGRADIVILDGGPGASGEVTALTDGLVVRGHRVLEPVQTGHSIADIIAGLRDDIARGCASPVVLVGWSWGAWLACLYAATYPDDVRRVVLLGCPPLTERGAKQLRQTRAARLSPAQTAEIEALSAAPPDPQITACLMQLFELSDAFDPLDTPHPAVTIDWEQHHAIWAEASALRRSGGLLDRVASLPMPVRALHGADDPHPAEDVARSLSALPDFRMTVIDACGHKPWREAQVDFLDLLAAQLT
ncbi:MAG: alpha/beta hydrolase [Pseudomonadota bacterium]